MRCNEQASPDESARSARVAPGVIGSVIHGPSVAANPAKEIRCTAELARLTCARRARASAGWVVGGPDSLAVAADGSCTSATSLRGNGVLASGSPAGAEGAVLDSTGAMGGCGAKPRSWGSCDIQGRSECTLLVEVEGLLAGGEGISSGAPLIRTALTRTAEFERAGGAGGDA